MTQILVIGRSGQTSDIINRKIQTGEKGELKGKKFVIYKRKRYVVEREDKLGQRAIFPWGY